MELGIRELAELLHKPGRMPLLYLVYTAALNADRSQYEYEYESVFVSLQDAEEALRLGAWQGVIRRIGKVSNKQYARRILQEFRRRADL